MARFLALGFLGIAACGVSTEDATSIESSLSAFTIDLGSAAPTVNLGEKVDVDVTITGQKGDVQLTVGGLPTGVTATSTITDGTARITLSAAVTAYVTPRDATVPITVTATSGGEKTSATANFRVAPNLTIYIPRNIEALYSAPGGPLRAEWGEAFGPNTQPLHTQPGNGIVISIFNNDTKQHIIHGPGGPFPHGDFARPVQPGAFELLANGSVRTRTLNVGNSATAYVHGEPNSTNAAFKVVVEATP